MKHFQNLVLVSVIAFGLLVTSCNASCAIYIPEVGKIKGCKYKGKLHRLGSTFRTKDCMDCSCGLDGSMECCQSYKTPVQYDKEKCTAVFNKKTCSYQVVEKKNRSRECDVFAMVG
ncbi:hypothetical protein XELAEV_18034825mg [Xenopus laevis]|uniref:Beta-microseminoprotein n=1 Tax=Xenopus laevis TaxID=8355 RepID=A0A974CEX5_XENLA|nr:hypothetical protein XELAEV_18034825mg [Xenopus laevis]